jgi:hypothetical protein
MKLAFRVFVFAIVVAGAAAASFSSSKSHMIASHLAATSAVGRAWGARQRVSSEIRSTKVL